MTHRLATTKIFGKSPLGAYLRLNRTIWTRLPPSIATIRPITAYGHLMNALVRLQSDRRQYPDTYFFRNRPELELIRRLASRSASGRGLRLAVLGCSNGAEAYSILWTLRTTLPHLKVFMQAVDISDEVLAVAREGTYADDGGVDQPIFERTTEDERRRMFETDGSRLRIGAWSKDAITWRVGDAADPKLVDLLGPQDIVVANRFLCHMEAPEAGRCLRNIARLVDTGGHLFVSGVDLDVRTKVARDLGWAPVDELREDIHEGDRSLRLSWPWKYCGLEPLDRRRSDWKVRYASVFQIDGPRANELHHDRAAGAFIDSQSRATAGRTS